MTRPSADDHLLDNAVWHTLRGPLARFAAPDSSHEWIRFDPEVNVFGAVERIDDSTWPSIASVIGIDGHCALFRDRIPETPSGWEELFRGRCLQMVAADVAEPSDLELTRLGPEDVPDMLALTKLTEPAPFFSRTYELGRYVGLRRNTELIAMAGERLRIPGYVEISAVCTHPDARGEGLAGEITLDVVRSIRENGSEAFLHVLDDNENAIRLYQKLGFVVRRKVDVVFACWRGPEWEPDPVDESPPTTQRPNFDLGST